MSKLFISSIFSLWKINGRRIINAIKYLNPAKVKGGISLRPSLIITNDVDHKNVTNRARKIAEVLDNGLEKIFTSSKLFSQKKS